MLIDHLRDDVNYYDQNSSGFCFLVRIRAFVFETSLGFIKFKYERKTKRILVVVVKLRHRANGLFFQPF